MSFNFMAAITVCSDFGAPKNSLRLFPLFPHLFAMKWWDQMPWSSFSECWALSQLFHSSLSLSPRGFLALFTFCHKGGVICISEVIDISPDNLDSSLCFFPSSVSHDGLCIEVKAGWQYTALTYSFSYLEPVCCSMSSSFLNVYLSFSVDSKFLKGL